MSGFFDDMNRGTKGDIVCPLCGNNEPGQVLLVPIPGTEEGNNIQAEQVHRRCAENIGYQYVHNKTIFFQSREIDIDYAKNIAFACSEALLNEEN